MSPSQTRARQPVTYLDSYALQFAPFGDQADERFFYAGGPLMQRLDLLTHLTRFGDSAVLVSGPAGSGKTTLLKHFIDQTIRQWNICQLDGEQFEQAPGKLVAIMGGHRDTALDILLDEWQVHTDPSQLLVIVVDNAEQLQPDDLKQLGLLLNSPYNERVRLVLFGSDETASRFNEIRQQGLFPETLQLLEMPRLSAEETSSYLMYRLVVAGYSGESPFSDTEVRAICKAADGRPGEINRRAHESLLERKARSRYGRIPPAGAGKKSRSLAWIVATAVVIPVVAYLGWQRYGEAPSSTLRSAGGTRITELPLQLPEPATLLTQPAPTAAPVIAPADDYNIPVDQAPLEVVTAALLPVAPTDEPAADQQPVPEDISPEKTLAELTVQEQDKTGTETETETETEMVSAPEPAETHVVPPLTAALEPAPVKAESTPAPEQPATTPEPQPAQPKTSGPHREPWLLQQPASSYTLQLLGSRSEKSISDFIRQYQLDADRSAWYRGTYKGADWYVLVYGIYADRVTAGADRDRLPAGVRKGKPWLRDLGSVQQSIRKTSSPQEPVGLRNNLLR